MTDSSGFETLFESIATDLRVQGFSVQKQVLPQHLVDGLHGMVTALAPGSLRRAGVGRAGSLAANPEIRRDEIAWIEPTEITATPEGQWLEFAGQLQTYLNRRLLLGLFSFESHFAHYAPGAFYKTHLDAFKGQANRVLSVVFYLNPQWGDDDGGEMVMYSDLNPDEEVCRVKPEAGTLAVFLSEDFPHEVLPARRDRYSIAGWYRVNSSSGSRVDPPA